MTESSVERLESLIASRTGLKLRLRQRESLNRVVADRVGGLGMNHADEYGDLLQADSAGAKAEWARLVGILTNNETYFFRDRGQIALLRDRILPELIAQNESTHTLRLWSAGCSTGEEAYTLAILVNELLPEAVRFGARKWTISILGTDIDEPSLLRASQGVFGPWSFRSTDLPIKQRYFSRQEGGWKISEACRSLVTIQSCNLVADPYPSQGTGIQEMDLILCRNVFIYFDPYSVSSVLQKFAKTLREGGYLMTGHVETSGRAIPTLAMRSFPESDIYQKATLEPKQLAKRALYAQRRLPYSDRRASAIASARPVANPVVTPVPAIAKTPGAGKTRLTEIWTLANLGHYAQAIEHCERLIEEQPFAFAPYELLASIAQEQGQTDEAKRLLKKAIYLSPVSPHLYMEIGAIYRNEGDIPRASRMESTALDLLRHLPPDELIELPEGPSVRECIAYLTAVSKDGA